MNINNYNWVPSINDNIWQVVRDCTGYYRSIHTTYKLVESRGETSIKQGLTFSQACSMADELYEIEQVMAS